MLYDPNWQKTKVQNDPFSFDSLIEWLEKQSADKVYCYNDSRDCLLAQYFTASGFLEVTVYSDPLLVHSGGAVAYPRQFNRIAAHGPHTFGAALERARVCVMQGKTY